MFNRIAATALAGCLVLAVPPPLKAQTEPAPGPYEATLDKLLANRDFAGLTRAALHDVTEQEPAMRALNWLQDQQIAHGGSVYIALLYSALLWKVSESVPEPQRQSLAQTAGASLLAARLMILSEGFQCADTSAPGARLDSLDAQVPEVSAYLASASEADKRLMIKAAFTIALKTFRNRENDVWLCRAGIGYYNKYFAKHPDVPGKETTVAGSSVTNVELPDDPSLLPDFAPFRDWKAERRAALDRLAQGSGVEPLTDYGDAQTRLK